MSTNQQHLLFHPASPDREILLEKACRMAGGTSHVQVDDELSTVQIRHHTRA